MTRRALVLASAAASQLRAAAPGNIAISSDNGLRACARATEMLQTGKDTLDAVIAGVNINEEDPEDSSVGYGGLPNEEGVVELDACVMHGFPGTDTVVEENGHIGHGAILHGCIVKANALVGMNAVVNDNAVIGESAIVAAMAFIKAGMIVPPRTLVAGVPARIVRELTEQEFAWKIEGTQSYQELTRRSLATMLETDALTRIKKTGKVPGILAFAEADAKRWIAHGAQFVAVTSDQFLLVRESAAVAARFKT